MIKNTVNPVKNEFRSGTLGSKLYKKRHVIDFMTFFGYEIMI